MAKLTYKDETGTITEIAIDTSKTILEMLEDAGIDYPFSCMAGACNVCKIKINKGKDRLKPDAFGEPLIPVADNEFLTCVCGISDATAADPSVEIDLEKS